AGTFWNLTGSGIAGSTGTATYIAELAFGTTNLRAIETLTLTCGTSQSTPAYRTGASAGLATTPITVSISTFPTGNAINTVIGQTLLTGGTPRYAATGGSVGPVTVINFTATNASQT